MQDILDKAYDKYAQGNLTESKMHSGLLCDPNLVEDYSDILKTMPKKLKEDEETTSANGSVVINQSSTHNSPVKGSAKIDYTPRSRARDEASGDSRNESTGNGLNADDNGDEDAYEYSDSEFEDDMETRLKDLHSGAKQGSAMKFFKAQDADHSSDDDLTVGPQRLGRIRPTNGNNDNSSGEQGKEDSDSEPYPDPISDSDEDEDEEEEEDFQPLPPPEEIDPSKLYALYPFQGPDPSHCQLYQDQSCVLLNDQDSYWWLVKRCDDGKIGFAPAEILETFPERLARLNCWKNENMSGRSVGSGVKSEDEEQGSEKSEEREGSLTTYTKGNKSVSFNDVVSYAERYIQEEEDGTETASGTIEHIDTDRDKTQHKKPPISTDKIYETSMEIVDDNASEVVSDASFNAKNTMPLQIKKVRTPAPSSSPGQESRPQPEDQTSPVSSRQENPNTQKLLRALDDGLHQTFKAPTVPFAGNKDIPKSNSNYSISTIGEYSPSSSEWTNDSPQANNGNFEVDSAVEGIPSTRAIKDISKIVSSIKVDELYDAGDEQDTIIQKVTTSDTATNETPHRESALMTSDESCIDEERNTSATTVNSTVSFNELQKFDHHPIVHQLYNPLFGKIDDLLKKLA